MKRTYLLTMFIKTAQLEHARIKQKLDALSAGETHVVTAHKDCIAVLFNSEEAFDTIGRSIESVTLSTDSFLLTELGQRIWQYRLNRSTGWLKSHQCAHV